MEHTREENIRGYADIFASIHFYANQCSEISREDVVEKLGDYAAEFLSIGVYSSERNRLDEVFHMCINYELPHKDFDHLYQYCDEIHRPDAEIDEFCPIFEKYLELHPAEETKPITPAAKPRTSRTPLREQEEEAMTPRSEPKWWYDKGYNIYCFSKVLASLHFYVNLFGTFSKETIVEKIGDDLDHWVQTGIFISNQNKPKMTYELCVKYKLPHTTFDDVHKYFHELYRPEAEINEFYPLVKKYLEKHFEDIQ